MDTLAANVVPGLAPGAYSAFEIQAAEACAVFQNAWILVGFLDDLRMPNDFLTRDIGGTSVMVHNFGGELRALHNVCSHRFSPIHCEARGNRAPRCPYHGWTFDRDGVPAGIPGNPEFFGLDRAARRDLAVRRFALGVCGRFVFVRIAAEGPGLEAYLGPLAGTLEHLSLCFTESFEEQCLDWAANWKLGVENVLEVYHADSVHPETFRQFAGEGWACTRMGDHSRGIAGISQASDRWWRGVRERLGLAVSDRYPPDRYDHTLIFPNLAIGVTAGAMMSVQTYEPIGPDRCRLRLRLWMAPGQSVGDHRPSRAARAAVEQRIRQFNLTVLDEDRRICEQVHRGTREARGPAVLGANEERIRAFHAALRRGPGMSGAVNAE